MSTIGNGDDVDKTFAPLSTGSSYSLMISKFPEGPFCALSHTLKFLFDILEIPFCIFLHIPRYSVDADLTLLLSFLVSAKYI